MSSFDFANNIWMVRMYMYDTVTAWTHSEIFSLFIDDIHGDHIPHKYEYYLERFDMQGVRTAQIKIYETYDKEMYTSVLTDLYIPNHQPPELAYQYFMTGVFPNWDFITSVYGAHTATGKFFMFYYIEDYKDNPNGFWLSSMWRNTKMYVLCVDETANLLYNVPYKDLTAAQREEFFIALPQTAVHLYNWTDIYSRSDDFVIPNVDYTGATTITSTDKYNKTSLMYQTDKYEIKRFKDCNFTLCGLQKHIWSLACDIIAPAGLEYDTYLLSTDLTISWSNYKYLLPAGTIADQTYIMLDSKGYIWVNAIVGIDAWGNYDAFLWRFNIFTDVLETIYEIKNNGEISGIYGMIDLFGDVSRNRICALVYDGADFDNTAYLYRFNFVNPYIVEKVRLTGVKRPNMGLDIYPDGTIHLGRYTKLKLHSANHDDPIYLYEYSIIDTDNNITNLSCYLDEYPDTIINL